MNVFPEIPKYIFTTLNQLYELEQKLKKHTDPNNMQRNINKMKDAFAEAGFTYEDPMSQPFKETRTDLDATISGSGIHNLVVVEVIKPIIRYAVRDGAGECPRVFQKGIVVVESEKGALT